MTANYTFFWSNNSPFSNWHYSEFILDGNTFYNSEQYMMWRKAKLFNDEVTAKKILKTKNPREQKALGRQVKGFKESIWNKNKVEIVKTGCLAKFSQNTDLKYILLASKGTLVEASPYDKIWGIGLREDQARNMDPGQWPGQNLLGQILTQVREELKN